jgi:hypothetical protein
MRPHLFPKLLASLVVALLAHATANAADWYAVTLRGTCKSVNGADKIGSRPLNQNTIIQEYLATLEEPPSARDVKLAYDPETDRIALVNTAGEVLTDVYTFGSGTVVANSTDTQRLRHVFLFPGSLSEAAGTAQLTERITRDAENAITRLAIRGVFQFASAGTEEIPTEICSGTFSVGKKLKFTIPEPEPEPAP